MKFTKPFIKEFLKNHCHDLLDCHKFENCFFGITKICGSHQYYEFSITFNSNDNEIILYTRYIDSKKGRYKIFYFCNFSNEWILKDVFEETMEHRLH